MSYLEKGKIVSISGDKQVTEKLTKRGLILETEGEYSQTLMFEAVNDKCRLLDNLRTGQVVEVHFNLRGRAYKDTAFNTLSLWKIE